MEMVLKIVMTVPISTLHISHKGVDCCLTGRSDPNGYVNDGKEGADNNDDDSVDNTDDGGDMHLAHITQ
eukprot:624961-Ditylum_brightwellii.AAC.1